MVPTKKIAQNLLKASKVAPAGSNLAIDGTPYTIRQFKKYLTSAKVADICSREVRNEVLEGIERDGPEYMERLSGEVYTALLGYFKHRAATTQGLEQEKSGKESEQAVARSFQYRRCVPIYDVLDTGRKGVFDVQKQEITELGHQSFKEWLMNQTQHMRDEVLARSLHAKLEYNPFSNYTVRSTQLNGQDCSAVNLHKVPEWRKRPLATPKLPREFKEYLDFFIPHAESKTFVLDWMHWMLVARNNTHLLLHGSKGGGKNTLGKICERLVGRLNYQQLDKNFFGPSARFNSAIRDKRCVLFDETAINEFSIPLLKAWANDFISIEEKGRNIMSCENHASFIIANNLPEDNKLAWDDRRFSVPEIRNDGVKLDTHFGPAWVERLTRLIEDNEDFIANIGWFLLNRKPKHNNFTPFITKRFHFLVQVSLKEWQRKLVSQLEDRQYAEIDVEDLPVLLGVNSIGRSKVESFLDSYRDEYGQRLASLIVRGTRKVIVPMGDYAVREDDGYTEMEF